jgi:hypothetical protein
VSTGKPKRPQRSTSRCCSGGGSCDSERAPRIGTGHFQHLAGGQVPQDIGELLADAKTIHRRELIFADHVLRQHRVGKVQFLDFSQHLGRVHVHFLPGD